MRATVLRLVSPLLVLLLAACGGGSSDRAVRSPDLPAAQLNSITAQCTDTTLTVGQTTQCTAECTYRVVNENGNVSITAPGACNGLSWRSDNTNVVSINNNGDATGIGQGITDVDAVVDGGSVSVQITVSPVVASCSVVYQRGAIADPVPDADCEPTADFNATAPVGVNVPFRAAVRLNNGALCYAPDAPVNQTPCPAGVVTFASSAPGVANFANAANGIASTESVGAAVITASASVNQVNLTVTAPVLNATLCVESVAPPIPNGCQAYNQPTVQCAADTVPDLTTNGAPFQFYARAFFDVGTAAGQVCDVTKSPNTTWSITLPDDAGSNPDAMPTVADDGNNKGLVSGGPQATTGATVRASFTDGTDTATGSHLFNVVVGQVIASNSLIASAVLFNNDPTSQGFAGATRAACVGSFDLVDGVAAPPGLPAQKRLFAALRRCPTSNLQGDGSCDFTGVANPLEDATNAEGVPGLSGVITWTASEGYWDGNQCVEPTDPTGLATVVGLAGDDEAGARYTDGAAFTGVGDARLFGAVAGAPVMDNGVAVSTGALSLGTVCVTARYNEGQAQSTDGITLIVLPVTNDSLLTDPEASSAVELCNTLVPLFNLGASPDGANGIPIQVLGAVASILNPLLSGLDSGLNTDDLLATVITALNPLTGPLSDALLTPILEAANDGLYTPLNCLIGTLLNALNTQTPGDIQACSP